MSYNTLKIKIDTAKKTEIQNVLNDLIDKTSFLINLTPAQNQKNLKMGSVHYTFAKKILLLVKTSPESVPSTVDIQQFEADLEMIQVLRSMQIKIATLHDSLKDTILALGHQSLQTANACYSFLKIANQINAEMDSNLAPILASKKHKKRKGM